ncbi:MAG: T9SS type A sorting domain-containing protein [Bacteroidia bacterium]|nr:T9SS type A sorting domain-containing protein [Bacteroidia bacterium]
MKINYPIKLLIILAITVKGIHANAQIENLIVETYYISDSLDATDSTQGRTIEPGSVTYRVYLDLAAGSKIKKIYGDQNHPLIIRSTEDLYNNIDRPNAYFGYLINRNWFSGNPTISLDSWLTLGIACRLSSTQYYGVLKTEDTDGSFVGGSNNQGGTSGIPGGILVNNDPEAGIPLTVADGYLSGASPAGQWFDYGFFDASLGHDTTVFGSLYTGKEFNSRIAVLQQGDGVAGITADNIVLVAQVTTKGQLSFELNVQLEEADGTIVHYVADDSVLINTSVPLYIERLSPFLKYPPVCGCLNTDYLEYSAANACENNDSCKTLIVFGCMDPLACNYNAEANYNIKELCCYPGLCADRDIEVVCPSLKKARLLVSPNPAGNQIVWNLIGPDNEDGFFTIYNVSGEKMLQGNWSSVSEEHVLEVGRLPEGFYILQVMTQKGLSLHQSFVISR